MIGQALECIASEINSALQRAPSDKLQRLVLSNLVDQDGHAPIATEDKVVLALIALDEEKNINDRPAMERSGSYVSRLSESVYLNLHVVFAATHRHYVTALDSLSTVMAYLKTKPTFTHQNTPLLPSDVERLNFNLERLSYSDLSNVWSFLGANYLPAATYTIRVIGLGTPRILSTAKTIEVVGVS